MSRKTFIGVSACATAIVFFVAGFFMGRNSLGKIAYHDITAAETHLLGQWQLQSPVDPLRSKIELRPDRTAIMYDDQGQASLVAEWGFFSNRLSLQNGHVPGEPGYHYMPPTVFNVLAIESQKMQLVTADGSVTWELKRL
jgi:hypothetical protein